MKNRQYSAGFTLAELLAVVIIVALLTSLGLGYYKRSVEQARFSEGLSMASALVEAVNQAYLEDQIDGVADAAKKRKISTLDFGLPNLQNCSTATDYCVANPRFEFQVEESNDKAYVRAYRGTVASHNYYIQIQPVFGSPKNAIACVGAKDFCESMGYTQCTDDSCTK